MRSGMRSETSEQLQGFLRALGSSLLQPVAALVRLQRSRFAAVSAELQLRLDVSGTRGLAQQLETEAAITGSAAVTAEQLTKTALC